MACIVSSHVPSQVALVVHVHAREPLMRWHGMCVQAVKILAKPVRLVEAEFLNGSAKVLTGTAWRNSVECNGVSHASAHLDGAGVAQLEAAAAHARTAEHQHSADSNPSTSQLNEDMGPWQTARSGRWPHVAGINGHTHALNGMSTHQHHQYSSDTRRPHEADTVRGTTVAPAARAPPAQPPPIPTKAAPPQPGARQSSEAAKRLTMSIRACRDWYQLRALLGTQDTASLNAVHIAASFSVVSKLAPASSLSTREAALMSDFLNLMLLPAVQRLLPSMGSRETVTVLHGLAVLGHAPRPAFLALFLRHLVALSPGFNARDAASSLWAVSRVAQCMAASAQGSGGLGGGQHVPQSLCDALPPLLSAAQSLLTDSNQQDLANLALGSARLHALTAPHDAAAHGMWAAWRTDLLSASHSRLRACGPQALANLLHGILQLPGPLPSAPWCSTFIAAAQPLLPACTPQALALLAGATARLRLCTATGHMAVAAAAGGRSAGATGGTVGCSSWPAALLHQVSIKAGEAGADDLVDVALALPVLLAACSQQPAFDTHTWLQGFEAVLQDRWAAGASVAVLENCGHTAVSATALSCTRWCLRAHAAKRNIMLA